jgi:membrane dipeptidase
MIPYFDAHCDTATRGAQLRKNDCHLDLERLSVFGPCAQVFAIFDRPEGTHYNYDETDTPYDQLFDLCRRHLAGLKAQFEENADLVVLCRSGDEAAQAARVGKTAAFIGVEGAELLGCTPEQLRWAYEEGVRFLTLTWNYPNPLCGSAMSRENGGLSPKGRDYVRLVQELGMVLDLSHASERGFWDVAETVEKPFIASHSNARALCSHPRNLTDTQFLELVRRGGCVGLNLYPQFLGGRGDLDVVVAHLEYFLALGGEKTVCLGTDFDGIDQTPEGIRGVQDMEIFYETLLQRNYPETLVQDLFYRNLMALVEVCL